MQSCWFSVLLFTLKRINALSWFSPIFVSPSVVGGLGLRNAFNDLTP